MLLRASVAAEQDLGLYYLRFCQDNNVCINEQTVVFIKMFTCDLNTYLSYHYVGLNNHFNG